MDSILIVDDSVEIRETLLILLNGIGTLSEASNGQEALRKIEIEKPKLMLLDIAMPEMGGIAVLEAALKIAPQLTVLMLTAECDIAIANKALEIGARAYITKPFDGPALRKEVAYLMSNATSKTPDSYKLWRVT